MMSGAASASCSPDQQADDACDDDSPDRHQVHPVAQDGALPWPMVTLERCHRVAARARQVVHRVLSHRLLRTLTAHHRTLQQLERRGTASVPSSRVQARPASAWSNHDSGRREGGAADQREDDRSSSHPATPSASAFSTTGTESVGSAAEARSRSSCRDRRVPSRSGVPSAARGDGRVCASRRHGAGTRSERTSLRLPLPHRRRRHRRRQRRKARARGSAPAPWTTPRIGCSVSQL